MVAVRAMQLEIWQDDSHILNIFEMDDGQGELQGYCCVIDRYTFQEDQLAEIRKVFEEFYGSICYIRCDPGHEGAEAMGNNFAVQSTSAEIWDKAYTFAKEAFDWEADESAADGEPLVRNETTYHDDGSRTVVLHFRDNRAYMNFFIAARNSHLNPYLSELVENLIEAKEAHESKLQALPQANKG